MTAPATAETSAALNSGGLQALKSGDAARAALLFERAAAADPQAGQLWLNLAAAHRALADAEGERAALERALEADQRDFMANLRLAELHERLGENGPAATRWGAVLALAAQSAQRPPALESVLARAQRYVADHSAAYAADLDRGLANARAGQSPRDLRRFDAMVDAATGRRRIYVNHCEGLHFPFLPADEFFDREHFPWLPDLEAATPAIAAELAALVADDWNGMRPYVEMPKGTPSNLWSPLDRKFDWSAFFLWRFGKRAAAACARCPETARVVESLPLARMPGRAPTAFFSILKPGTRLPAHTGVSNLRAICHLALKVPPDCGFRVGGETREWREGEAFVFDDTIEHEAWNLSDDWRGVLILDVWNPHLTATERDLVAGYLGVADRSAFNPGLRVGD